MIGAQICFIGAVIALMIPDARPDSPPSTPVRSAKKEDPIVAKLRQPVSFRFEKGPLKDAFGHLAWKYKFSFDFDTAAFRRVGTNDVPNCPVELERVVNVPLCQLLHMLLDQVAGAFEVVEGRLHIIPKQAAKRG